MRWLAIVGGFAVVLPSIVSAQTLLDRRASQNAPAGPVAEIHLEGVDLSDAAVTASALANCGPAQVCAGSYREKRDRVAAMFAAEKGRRKTIIKILAEETNGGVTNWNLVEMRLSAKYDYVSVPWQPLATCRTWVAGGTASTTCYIR